MSFRWRPRHLKDYPDEFGMEQDICDLTLRLTELHSLSRVNVWVDRNYTYIGRQIAGVTVMTSPRHPARLPKVARDAFRAPLHDQKIRTQISTANRALRRPSIKTQGHSDLCAHRMCAKMLALDIGHS